MEQQEKKKRKIQRSISTQSSSMSSIPLDVTSKILAKLPAKSVLRARCVSKQWSSISTDPYFISNMFPKQSSSSLLIFFKPKRKLFVISIHQNPNEPQHVGICPRLDLFPNSKKTHYLEPYLEKILNLAQTQKQLEGNTIGDNDGQCINGVLYYRASLDQSNVDIIMSFDVSTMYNKDITLWVLEDAKWLCKHFTRASYNDQPLQALSGINGITDDGEFIYVAYVLDSFYILYYDPEKKSYRRVDLQGVGDADFMLRNGLGNMDGIRIHTCLNIESLLSL
ncbi:hypothetical protein [Arabidopsis thaliana]|uniref:Putative F-box protein At1g50880 n=1 Tax=Arabidopsis thaliana TaxID=3702 RepID=FB53_ARATH|nr:F-box and associated interaction domains-containing protein [Arabidopsis thaliana]Q9C6J2.1 RecName: Full=Putative F-box protein At1g50880 [Arabidopsis thaliana]AAG50950.1 hypothetical protein [Arabidopsis thaliana]AEE32597.1 F-box and associated interaction domains-containing protein [Arabidopsis thaliana]|eukprot:NP_175501.1 F-box and associated interaction domains-containing protein [Arabidopsis thaliana]